jgi:hypothetical protein
VDSDFGEFYRGRRVDGPAAAPKVAGIFARLTLRDGKPRYLADAPRFIAYIRATASRYRELAPLARLVDEVEGTRRGQRLRLRPALTACRASTAPSRCHRRALALPPAGAPRAGAAAAAGRRADPVRRPRRRVRRAVEHMGRSEVRVRSQRTAPSNARAGVAVHLAWACRPTSAWTGWWRRRPNWASPRSSRCWPSAACSGWRASGRRRNRRTGRRWRWRPASSAGATGCQWCIRCSRWWRGWRRRRRPASCCRCARGTQALARAAASLGEVTLLSGPEGGLAPAEEDAALARGWQAVHLGPRVLRAETAPLAALAVLTLAA